VPVLPLPPFVDVTVPVVLLYDPPAAATTLTVIVQLLLAGMEPSLKLILPPAATAVKVPPQVLEVVNGVAFINPVGYVSEKAAPLSTVLAFEFVKVNVSVEFTFATTGFGEKDFAIVGGAITVKFAVLEGVPAVRVSFVVTPLVWFGFTPKVLEVT
jgi:hypothetical protein